MTISTRDFYTAVIEANVSEDVTLFAQDAIAKMDASNAKNRGRASEKRAEAQLAKAPVREAILGVLSENAMTASEIVEAIAEKIGEVKPASIPSLIKPFVEDGTVTKTDVKRDKRTVKGYALAPATEA